MKLIAGGNAPGKLKHVIDPERVAGIPKDPAEICARPCDPFRVGRLVQASGGVAPGY